MSGPSEYWRKDNHMIVLAMQVEEDASEAANWAQAQIVVEHNAINDDPQEGLNVKTAKGTQRASQGMYVVFFGGHFMIAGKDEFEMVYELVPDETTQSPLASTTQAIMRNQKRFK